MTKSKFSKYPDTMYIAREEDDTANGGHYFLANSEIDDISDDTIEVAVYELRNVKSVERSTILV